MKGGIDLELQVYTHTHTYWGEVLFLWVKFLLHFAIGGYIIYV